jgi:hypothetical protein
VPEVRGGETDVTDYQRALSVIAAYELEGVGGVVDWLRREFAVAEARGASQTAALARVDAEITQMLADCRRVVPDLAAVDAGD